jgi:hypothetical protein
MFPVKDGLKQGVASSPLLFDLVLEYAIRSVQVSQDGLILNGAHQLLVYVVDINILSGSKHTIKKIAEAFEVVSKEIRREVNADNIKYTVMSLDQSGGQNQNIKNDNKSGDRVEKFKYLGTS